MVTNILRSVAALVACFAAGKSRPALRDRRAPALRVRRQVKAAQED
jgi:hypothetical protein